MAMTVSRLQDFTGPEQAPAHLVADAVPLCPLSEQHLPNRPSQAANPTVSMPRTPAADQRGRCSNFEYCSNAVSKKIITIPGGSEFACPRCGHALRAISAGPARRWSRTFLALLVAVVTLGGAMLAYKLTSLSGNTPTLWAFFPNGPSRAAMHDNPPAEHGRR